MKKILLLLTALFVMGGGEVSARDVNATLASGVPNGSASWTKSGEAYKCEWSGAESYMSFFEAFGGTKNGELDWSAGVNFIFTCVDATTDNNALNVVIVANGKSFSRAMYSSGMKTLTLTATTGDGFKKDGWSDYITSEDLKHVTDIRLQAVAKFDKTLTDEGSFMVTNMKVELNEISCSVPKEETPLNELSWNRKDGTGTDKPDWYMNTSTDTYYGNYSGDPTHYVDLTGYSELRVYPNSEEGFRAFFINAEGTATTQIRNDVAVWNSEGNYWSLDLSKITKYNDMVALKAIKSPQSGQKGIIKNIVAYKDLGTNAPQYILKGWGELSTSVAEALADASAKVIDATGVTGTNVALESANPNCIFLANAGALSNTKNVQIGNTIANLEITDKKPLADLTGVTATAATYTRSMTNQFGTICLPYAVTSTESVKYYTIDNLDGNVLTLKEETELAAGTPAIVEKVSGESITAEGSGALVAAGAPTGNLELIGTFEEKTVLAADYAGKNIYAIKNNQFVQGLNSITVPAFRAYFTADASAEANLRLAFGDEATAIDSLTGEKSIKAIYSVSGASQASLQKGMNIVEFTDGSVKKVMVK